MLFKLNHKNNQLILIITNDGSKTIPTHCRNCINLATKWRGWLSNPQQSCGLLHQNHVAQHVIHTQNHYRLFVQNVIFACVLTCVKWDMNIYVKHVISLKYVVQINIVENAKKCLIQLFGLFTHIILMAKFVQNDGFQTKKARGSTTFLHFHLNLQHITLKK